MLKSGVIVEVNAIIIITINFERTKKGGNTWVFTVYDGPQNLRHKKYLNGHHSFIKDSITKWVSRSANQSWPDLVRHITHNILINTKKLA